jgi:hypothetical protein
LRADEVTGIEAVAAAKSWMGGVVYGINATLVLDFSVMCLELVKFLSI